jgi:hypothetical protein
MMNSVLGSDVDESVVSTVGKSEVAKLRWPRKPGGVEFWLKKLRADPLLSPNTVKAPQLPQSKLQRSTGQFHDLAPMGLCTYNHTRTFTPAILQSSWTIPVYSSLR